MWFGVAAVAAANVVDIMITLGNTRNNSARRSRGVLKHARHIRGAGLCPFVCPCVHLVEYSVRPSVRPHVCTTKYRTRVIELCVHFQREWQAFVCMYADTTRTRD